MTEKKPLTKAQTLTALSEKIGVSKKEVNVFLDAMVELAYKEVKRAGKFTIPGIGALKKVKRKARMGRNPATGETIKIPAKTVAKFTLAKACKDELAPKK